MQLRIGNADRYTLEFRMRGILPKIVYILSV